MKNLREYLESKDSSFIMESRDKTVPVEFRTSFGVLQRLYNPKQVPDIKELEKDSKTVAKRYKLDAGKFFEFAKKRFKEIYGNKIYEDAEDKDENEECEDDLDEAKLTKSKYKEKKQELIDLLWTYDKGEGFNRKEDIYKEYKMEIDTIMLGKIKVSRALELLGFDEQKHKNDKDVQKIKNFLQDNLNEAAVGQRGRTSYREAQEYCDENEELVDEFRKIIKKLGGKTVAKALLDKLSQKPEIKDEIDNIEDIVDNSNY